MEQTLRKRYYAHGPVLSDEYVFRVVRALKSHAFDVRLTHLNHFSLPQAEKKNLMHNLTFNAEQKLGILYQIKQDSSIY